ncbi:sensor histidine kinase [Aquabacterium sp. NJ1]|uniref:sensor histidine kinase n=1 Tax=Aquabacterium sp. NJ1 TaxID=1538295 RepID=UPI000691C324|nr:sensor histidine kinase [Aquabacterium sp. NJ1]
MSPNPSLDPPPHQAPPGSPACQDKGHLLRTLLVPNARRIFVTMVVWAVLMAVYSRLMEEQGLEVAHQYGLWLYLSGNLGGGLINYVVLLTGWYAVASRWWLKHEDARQRYATEGMYALLPWKLFLPLMIGLSLIGSALTYEAWSALMARTNEWATMRKQMNLGGNLLISLLYSTGIFSIDYFRVRAAMLRIRMETAQRLHVEAQLQRLQAQMEPHMLFNTLANLHALIETQPGKAQDMLSHLIDYLRATLSASRTGAVPLRDEMARVQDYLALMQIRMGERLRVITDVPADLRDVALPPMLIQPLVENAIKHGLDPLPDGGTLHVLVQRDRDMLEITVRDDGQGLDAARATPSNSGFGLSCVQARLQTSYGPDARLILEPGSQGPGARMAHLRPGTVAILRLPVQMPALVHTLPTSSPLITP